MSNSEPRRRNLSSLDGEDRARVADVYQRAQTVASRHLGGSVRSQENCALITSKGQKIAQVVIDGASGLSSDVLDMINQTFGMHVKFSTHENTTTLYVPLVARRVPVTAGEVIWWLLTVGALVIVHVWADGYTHIWERVLAAAAGP